ncbi:transcriptional repressor [Candidatus Haliotispira prima]|uniref:Transcriptional repressor n=1 Tax=Candidatus Haliotispira prima TaxID=3034016 RepID=A0ABY8MHH3_9SPIO|nr:transcriptional repressor [Candidatus Haliotispira prima]
MNRHVHDLRSRGVHPSYQRVRILEFVRNCRAEDFFEPGDANAPGAFAPSSANERKDYHPTAEQIHACLVKDIPTLSKTTVYNTLRLFEENGLISSVMIDQHGSHGALRYDRYIEAHAHLLCRSCGELLDWPLASELETRLAGLCQTDPELHSWQLVLRGACRACQPKCSA